MSIRLAKTVHEVLLPSRIVEGLEHLNIKRADGLPITLQSELPDELNWRNPWLLTEVNSIAHYHYSTTNLDLHYFANLTKLQLNNCSVITDLSMLRVQYVKLYSLVNLSSLTLSSVTKLKINGCPKLSSMNLPATLKEVSIYICRKLKDISALKDVTAAHLRFLPIKDVSALCNVRVLVLAYLKKLKDISALTGVQKIKLQYCNAIEDVSSLRYAEQVQIYNCDNVTDTSALQGVKHLRINNHHNESFESLQQVGSSTDDVLAHQVHPSKQI